MNKLKILLISMICMVSVAYAQTVMQNGIRYTDPTQYTNGDPLPPSELERRTLKCGTSSGAYNLSMVAPAGGLVTKEDIFEQLALDYGVEYFCAMTATATNGRESGDSNEVNFIVEDQRVPAAPVLVLE